MEIDGLYNKTFTNLSSSMDLRAANHRMISSNIANIDTPNYKAFDFVVNEEMKKLEQTPNNIKPVTTHPEHISLDDSGFNQYNCKVRESSEHSLRNDGNTVDLDREMAEMSKNNLMYNVSAQLLSKKIQQLMSVIQGGR